MSDISLDFDGPVIEPVKGFGDVKFARADMAYWSGWATALKAKRYHQFKAELDKLTTLAPLAKAKALADAQNVPVQIFELLDQQFTPDGIDKILLDAFIRAGGEAGKWAEIKKRMGPGRQQQIASEICSEPRPTTQELRESLREMLRKAHRSTMGVDSMTDEELIATARDFNPREKEEAQEGNGHPLAGGEESSSSASRLTETSTEPSVT